MFIVNPILVILKDLLAGFPSGIITVAVSFLQGFISVAVMFFVNKIIFTDSPKEEQLLEEKTEA